MSVSLLLLLVFVLLWFLEAWEYVFFVVWFLVLSFPPLWFPLWLLSSPLLLLLVPPSLLSVPPSVPPSVWSLVEVEVLWVLMVVVVAVLLPVPAHPWDPGLLGGLTRLSRLAGLYHQVGLVAFLLRHHALPRHPRRSTRSHS